MNITDIFYEEIVPEAALGKINVFFMFSVAFGTNLIENNKNILCKIDIPDVVIPTLMIKNKELFDSLLTEYVTKAMDFYDDDGFYDEVLNYKNKYNELIGKPKLIMTQLFANATGEDFNDPISFLRKRIAFIDNHKDKNINLGYSKILDANLELIILKDSLNNEAPSQLVVRATDGKEKWISPRVKFGIDSDTVYIYAIQNGDKNDGSLSKKINRKLYKVGEGFNASNEVENLKDITASFLVILNMAISYFRSLGYEKIVVPSMLVVRWNAKKIILNHKQHVRKGFEETMQKLDNELEVIQRNLTNKLIRTFLRLACHYNNIDIVSFPYELDSSLHMKLDNEIMVQCNNQLLLETGEMVNKTHNDLTK